MKKVGVVDAGGYASGGMKYGVERFRFLGCMERFIRRWRVGREEGRDEPVEERVLGGLRAFNADGRDSHRRGHIARYLLT